MTNEQASKVIQQGLNDFSIDYLDNEQLEALNMAIQVLQADGDLISRQAVLDALEVSYLKSEIDDDTYQRIRDMPSVAIPQDHDGCKDCRYESQYENEIPCMQCKQNYTDKWQKKPHWIDREVYDADRWKCSECGRTEQYRENYCPKCGAKMD